jgi:hypothetical protein
VTTQVAPIYRHPPLIYRTAQVLRWFGIFVLVALVLYAGSVAYSAAEVAHASVQSRSLSAVSVSNGAIEINGSFTLTNPGYYPIQDLELAARIANATGVHLGTITVGPDTVPGGGKAAFPIAIAVPIAASLAAESLLVEDQYIEVHAWANVTYAYLFPLSVTLSENRSWGAPFEGLKVSVGTPVVSNGTVTTPVTISFSNHASFVENGGLSFEIESSSSADCGGGSFSLDVPPGALYDKTQNVTLNTGCDPMGGEVVVTYTIYGSSTTLPPEPIP